MTEVDNHFTVFIRLPFNRGEFVDPPPVSWSAAKERALWEVMSKQTKGKDLDWKALAEELEVTQPFLLQQAAWLYERQLSQVRAQMKKVGSIRTSNNASPAPASMSGSTTASQPMKRGGSHGSRAPSRLSFQMQGSPALGTDSSTPGTPNKSRASLPLRQLSGQVTSQARGPSGTQRPLSRQSSRENQTPNHSRRGSVQHQLSKSPAQPKPAPADSDSDDANMSRSKMISRRTNPTTAHRRTVSLRKDQAQRAPVNGDSEDDSDPQTFLPFANTSAESKPPASTSQDPSATLRVDLPHQPQRPTPHRQPTSERIRTSNLPANLTSSNSSLSSNAGTGSPPQPTSTNTRPPIPRPTSHPTSQRDSIPSQTQAQPTSTLSPRQQAVLANLTPRRRSAKDGSDTSPSMGSSFSDLDDASVTQSALEEALMSNMGNTAMTLGGTIGTVGNRASGISQALRSRYFDANEGRKGSNGGGVGGNGRS